MHVKPQYGNRWAFRFKQQISKENEATALLFVRSENCTQKKKTNKTPKSEPDGLCCK